MSEKQATGINEIDVAGTKFKLSKSHLSGGHRYFKPFSFLKKTNGQADIAFETPGKLVDEIKSICTDQNISPNGAIQKVIDLIDSELIYFNNLTPAETANLNNWRETLKTLIHTS